MTDPPGVSTASHSYLARILATVDVAGAHHLLVDDDVDALLTVPLLTHVAVDDGNVDHLQLLGSDTGACRQSDRRGQLTGARLS